MRENSWKFLSKEEKAFVRANYVSNKPIATCSARIFTLNQPTSFRQYFQLNGSYEDGDKIFFSVLIKNDDEEQLIRKNLKGIPEHFKCKL